MKNELCRFVRTKPHEKSLVHVQWFFPIVFYFEFIYFYTLLFADFCPILLKQKNLKV